MALVRLNKHLKDLGICSRRMADIFIAKGYVLVNDRVITDMGYKLDPMLDKVEILEELATETANFKYILLNKPCGYVCSHSLLDGANIFELLPKLDKLAYAGRLDKDSSGLLILSNDGKFVYSVSGAEFAMEKEYLVRVNKPITNNFIVSQQNGSIKLDGKRVKMAKVKVLDEYTYTIILTQGINRQIRRMAENQGYKVIKLHRYRIAHINDKDLAVGDYRTLTKEEINNFIRHES